MNFNLIKSVLLMTGIILLLLSCNKSPTSLEFKDHPATRLVVSNSKLNADSGIWSIDWSTPSLLTLLVTGRAGQWPVYISDIRAGSLIPVKRDGKDLWSSSPKLSPNGKYIAYQSIQDYPGVYVATLDEQSDASIGLKNEKLAIDISTVSSLAWSPDSQRLAVLSKTKDGFSLYLYDLLDESAKELFIYKEANINYVDSLSWSSDGDKLAFALKYSIPEEKTSQIQSDVFIYYIDENRLVRLTSSPDISEAYPAWFPKGDIITYTSTPGMGSTLIGSNLVFSARDGKCTKVVPGLEGIESPSWSPDGTEIAFKSADGVEIMHVDSIISSSFLSTSDLCDKDK